jgi:hypothetical protein
MATTKGKSSKRRAQIKELPSKNRKLSGKDLKKIKGGGMVIDPDGNFKFKPPTFK